MRSWRLRWEPRERAQRLFSRYSLVSAPSGWATITLQYGAPNRLVNLYRGRGGTPKLEGASLNCRSLWRVGGIGREASSSIAICVFRSRTPLVVHAQSSTGIAEGGKQDIAFCLLSVHILVDSESRRETKYLYNFHPSRLPQLHTNQTHLAHARRRPSETTGGSRRRGWVITTASWTGCGPHGCRRDELSDKKPGSGRLEGRRNGRGRIPGRPVLGKPASHHGSDYETSKNELNAQ